MNTKQQSNKQKSNLKFTTMKKMNKMYEAPMAEVIEMQNVAVLMASGPGDGPSGTGEDPNNDSGSF